MIVCIKCGYAVKEIKSRHSDNNIILLTSIILACVALFFSFVDLILFYSSLHHYHFFFQPILIISVVGLILSFNVKNEKEDNVNNIGLWLNAIVLLYILFFSFISGLNSIISYFRMIF